MLNLKHAAYLGLPDHYKTLTPFASVKKMVECVQLWPTPERRRTCSHVLTNARCKTFTNNDVLQELHTKVYNHRKHSRPIC
jgi:hypothetical protein